MHIIDTLFSPNLSVEEQVQILQDINKKGITAEQISAVVGRLHEQQALSLSMPNAVDVCGTGGSGLSSINTSTIGAFILASLGISVVKHGNRASSGSFGSFDLVDALGISFETTPEHLHYLFWKTNLAFCFAPQFHPIMGSFKEARKQLGGTSIFNLVGPLLNPANTGTQIIGTAYKEHMQSMAETALKQGKKHVWIVRGQDGLDEITLSAKTDVLEIKDGVIRSFTIEPKDFGLKPVPQESILEESVQEKINLAESILTGKNFTAHADLVLVNVAAVLVMKEKASSLKDGYKQAKEALESKQAYKTLQQYTSISNDKNVLFDIVGNTYTKIVQKESLSVKKTQEKKRPSFKKALQKPGCSIISEIKKASPSHGVLLEDFNPIRIGQAYEKHGASAISVLCNERYFQGSLKYLKQVSEAVSIPTLCKDFIIDDIQIHEASQSGASAILLIASVLDAPQLQSLLNTTRSLGMDALVEIHTVDEMMMVLTKTDADIIGVNNRNLGTLDIDIQTTHDILNSINPALLEDKVLITESGIKTPADIQSMPKNIQGALVGASLMKEPSLLIDLVSAKPIVKICGIRTLEILSACEDEKIDMIGLNFVPTSSRYISVEKAKKILSKRKKRSNITTVGIFQNQSLCDVNTIAETLNLDFVQLSGEEPIKYVQQCNRPVIKGIPLRDASDIETARSYRSSAQYILFESHLPGKAEQGNHSLLSDIDFPFLLAGGLHADNIKTIPKTPFLIGFDTASGVENNQQKSPTLIHNFAQACHSKNSLQNQTTDTLENTVDDM